jgi:hypothetical protein
MPTGTQMSTNTAHISLDQTTSVSKLKGNIDPDSGAHPTIPTGVIATVGSGFQGAIIVNPGRMAGSISGQDQLLGRMRSSSGSGPSRRLMTSPAWRSYHHANRRGQHDRALYTCEHFGQKQRADATKRQCVRSRGQKMSATSTGCWDQSQHQIDHRIASHSVSVSPDTLV